MSILRPLLIQSLNYGVHALSYFTFPVAAIAVKDKKNSSMRDHPVFYTIVYDAIQINNVHNKCFLQISNML